MMVEAYRQLSEVTDAPLHLGVTEAGPPPAGLLKATAGIATLLLEGIGDTIRYSLTADPVEEARAGRQLLEALGLRERKNVDLIACPSCRAAQIDVIDVANRAMEAFGDRKIPLQVAVMGCVVNGPGEAREADLGIAAGNKRGHLFVKGRNVAVVPESEMVERWSSGPSSSTSTAPTPRSPGSTPPEAEREAAKDRAKLLDDKGADANHAEREDRRDPQDHPLTLHPLLHRRRERYAQYVRTSLTTSGGRVRSGVGRGSGDDVRDGTRGERRTGWEDRGSGRRGRP